MGQVQNSQNPGTAGRYPKRKRAQIDYYEENADLDMVNEKGAEDQDVEEFSQPKKPKSKASLRPLPKRKIFPFMELPAEVRNMIYGHCLIDPAGVYLSPATKHYRRTVSRSPEEVFKPNWQAESDANTPSDSDTDSEGEDKKKGKDIQKPSSTVWPLVPALLAVCKQMFQEGCHLLYGNDFYLGDTLAMHSFLVDIGPRAASLLKSVTLISWGRGRVHKAYNHAGFTALSSATNLEKFKLHAFFGWRSGSMWVARQFYRDAFPWLEAVGAAKGRDDAAVDIIEIATETVVWSGCYRWYHTAPHYKEISGFRNELSKLLNQRMKMIRS